MKHFLILFVALAGCAGQTNIGPEMPDGLQLEARGIERACGVAEATLLHPNADGNLEVWSVAGADISYPRFACVWSAVQNAKLSERGIEIVLMGEDAPR